ncbi:unnamed protein product [Linum trigynum]|uniref:Uncharacterized protein n=1 Tax=Linum trigynum TaxID=586398 RepID=A0AAV2E7Y1_9ROSI
MFPVYLLHHQSSSSAMIFIDHQSAPTASPLVQFSSAGIVVTSHCQLLDGNQLQQSQQPESILPPRRQAT